MGTLTKIICPTSIKCPVKLMLDSGAFSAWAQNTTVDFNAYAAFLEKHFDCLDTAINMDVIPGRPGEMPSITQVDEAAEASWKNLKRLEKRGFKVMPVYHFGEKRYWLEKLIGEGYQYIGLGGVAGRPEKIRKPWLDQMFAYLCRPNGVPCVRIHGLGLTSMTMMLRYPWFSVDSVSATLQGAMGKVLLPRRHAGKWDYTRPARGLHLSERPPFPLDHIRHQGEKLQKLFHQFLKEEKISYEEAVVDQIPRIQLCTRVARRIAGHWTPKPFKVRIADLFDRATQPPKPGVEFDWEHLTMFLGVHIGDTRDRLFTLEQHAHRLVSFWDFYSFKKMPNVNLKHYVANGHLDRGEPK